KAAALARDWVAPGDAIAQWTHFVTSTCNAKCRHCFYPINQRTDELTLAELEQLAATLPPIRLLLISGGEPFLRRDLPELLRVYWERCRFFSVSIPTNGFSAERIAEAVRRICAISPDLQLGMTVSLDGFEEFHDAMRQVPGLYRKATETLRALVALSAELPNLTAGVNTVFMNANQDRMDEFCAMIRSEFAPTYHSLILVRGKPADPQLDMSVDVPKFRRISRWLDERYSGRDDRAAGLGRRVRAVLPGRRARVHPDRAGRRLRLRVDRRQARQRARGRFRLSPHPRGRSCRRVRACQARAPVPLHPRVQRAHDDPVQPEERCDAGRRHARGPRRGRPGLSGRAVRVRARACGCGRPTRRRARRDRGR
ncbi:MAG: hypothetical protein H6Q02_372, partial [Acidobacteria bacterium]|nr:hypothetical protein [Acidobacteriota bacterium]